LKAPPLVEIMGFVPNPSPLSLALSRFGRRREGRGGRVCCFMLGVSQLLQWVIDLVEGISRWWPAAENIISV
jgi:hypothetical protein